MREIKFRAWDKELGMTNSFALHSSGLVAYLNNEWLDEKQKPVLMQYTGLKDKNGREIYEGDVVYISGFGNYQVKHIGADYDTLLRARIENDMGEVIGNIYENPELLKEEKND